MLAVNSDLNGPSPQFTLACISTGGPATTVTWTRDSTTVTQGTQTVLNDTVTGRYTHTLTVTGILGGNYTCTVANDKPSSASSSFCVEGTLCSRGNCLFRTCTFNYGMITIIWIHSLRTPHLSDKDTSLPSRIEFNPLTNATSLIIYMH